MNSQLPFIGLTITRNNSLPQTYSTCVYRKPTFTGLYTDFSSNVPKQYKLALIWSLVHRAFHLSSTYSLFHDEIMRIKDTVLQNGYPLEIFERCVNKFLRKTLQPSPTKLTVPRLPIMIGLPYIGKHSLNIRAQLQRWVARYYPHVDLKVYFRCARKMSSLFKCKDTTPFALRSKVVYCYTCASCDASYIGKTSRHLHTRICEHLGISSATSKPLKTPVFSAIREHQCSARPSAECFKVLTSGSSDMDILTREALLIRERKPSLNGNLGQLDLVLFN